MLSFTVKEVLKQKCSLGEGLIVQDDTVAWVDINKKQIFVYDYNRVKIHETRSTPSVIFSITDKEILFGSDEGLSCLSRLNYSEEIIMDARLVVDSQYRSNDGCNFNRFKILSFMHKTDPIKYSGYIYILDHNGWTIIDDSIHIPNSFIQIDNNKLLISDSLSSEIWLFEFNQEGNVVSKEIWTLMEKNVSPDGGCLVGNKIFISLWDGGSIAIFNIEGKLEHNIKLDVIRPTNCKIDKSGSILWVTSAREGLDPNQLRKYPLSGDVFKISVNSIC